MKIEKVVFLFLLAIVGVLPATAGTFVPIKEPECLKEVSGLFTTNGAGVQYPQPGGGVLDGWSMVTRWQGAGAVNNPIGYDLGRFTGLQLPAEAWASHQRGLPEGTHGPQGVQIYCTSGGMVINTWDMPHRHILGGGYNDMFGYKWPDGKESLAFYVRNFDGAFVDSDLVIQADVGVSWFSQHNASSGTPPDTQVALILSVKDVSHPDLAPIVLVTALLDAWPANLAPGNGNGVVGCDFGPDADPARKGGVWFTGGTITRENNDPYATVVYTGAYSQLIRPIDDTEAPMKFFRIHHTQENMKKLVDKINSTHVGGKCPKNGYSTDLHDYVVSYASIIMESTLWDGVYDGSMGSAMRDQVVTGMQFRNLGVYAYVQ